VTHRAQIIEVTRVVAEDQRGRRLSDKISTRQRGQSPERAHAAPSVVGVPDCGLGLNRPSLDRCSVR